MNLPKEENQHIIDRFLSNPHYKKFFRKTKAKLYASSHVNKINHYNIESDSDVDQPYFPAKELSDRVAFDHVKLPAKMLRLTEADSYNYTVGEALITADANLPEGSIYVLSENSHVLGPGDELNIPIRIVNRSRSTHIKM